MPHFLSSACPLRAESTLELPWPLVSCQIDTVFAGHRVDQRLGVALCNINPFVGLLVTHLRLITDLANVLRVRLCASNVFTLLSMR